MNKSAAFEAGIKYALEKEAIFGRLLKKAPKPFVPKFQGHSASMKKALDPKLQQKGAVTHVKQRVQSGGGTYATKKTVKPLEIKGLTDQPFKGYG